MKRANTRVNTGRPNFVDNKSSPVQLDSLLDRGDPGEKCRINDTQFEKICVDPFGFVLAVLPGFPTGSAGDIHSQQPGL